MLLATVTVMGMFEGAEAQAATVAYTPPTLQRTCAVLAVALFTVSIGWAVFKMAFQRAKWPDISTIVIGGILVGGVAEVVALLSGSR